MTPEHEEAVRLAEKYGGVWGHDQSKLYIFDQPQLADLITEVRRQKGEEDAALCDAAFADANWNPLLKNAAGVCADTIRARMEEGK